MPKPLAHLVGQLESFAFRLRETITHDVPRMSEAERAEYAERVAARVAEVAQDLAAHVPHLNDDETVA